MTHHGQRMTRGMLTTGAAPASSSLQQQTGGKVTAVSPTIRLQDTSSLLLHIVPLK